MKWRMEWQFSEIDFLKDKKKEQSFVHRSGLNEKKNASKKPPAWT